MTSGLTLPMTSPSTIHRKSSASIAFLSSIPYGARISSFHEIPQRVLHFHRRAERLKIISAVPFEKVSILVRRLHPVVFGAVIFCFDDLSDHAARRNIEDAVEMQSSVFSAALPYADMFPAFTGDKMLERVAQGARTSENSLRYATHPRT